MYDKSDFINFIVRHGKDGKPILGKKYRITCDICGEKQGYNCPRLNKQNFCKKCQYAKLSETFSQPKISGTCDACGKIISKIKSEWESRKKHFCDRNCAGLGSRKDITAVKRHRLKDKMLQSGVIAVCVACGHEHLWNLQAHHKVFVSNGGSNELSNLEFRCRNCHADLHHEIGKDSEE